MTHFYGVSPWSANWSGNVDVGSTYGGGAGQLGGWSTSWDDMGSDSGRLLRKQDGSSTMGGQVNGAPNSGFGGVDAATPNLTTGAYEKSRGFYEILPGQTWEQVMPATLPTKPHLTTSVPVPQPTVAKPIAKPAVAPTSLGWVEVTSSQGWTTTPALGEPTQPSTPTKNRQKSIEPSSSPSGPLQAPPSPGDTPNASNNKRHRDIEDELGHQDRYKTELCRSWHESGTCRYGSKCQFAHGAHELRPVMRHPKYKTEPCRSWVETRTCPYGRRCRFIHSDVPHAPTASSGAAPLAMTGLAPASALLPTPHPHMAELSPQHHGPSSHLASAHLASPHHPSHHTTSNTANTMLMMSPHHMYMAEMNGLTPNGVSSTRGLNPTSQYAQHPLSHSHHPSNHLMPQQHQTYAGWSNSSIPNNSPPYSPQGSLGFSMPIFNGSPPLALNSREHLAAARASNAPWLSDTYQEDDTDEYDPLSESLRLTPLIEQLNLHAEPVSPSTSHPNTTPIGSAPIGSKPSSAPTQAPTSQPLNASEPTADATEKSKKKKGSRLNIFQRLSSK